MLSFCWFRLDLLQPRRLTHTVCPLLKRCPGSPQTSPPLTQRVGCLAHCCPGHTSLALSFSLQVAQSSTHGAPGPICLLSFRAPSRRWPTGPQTKPIHLCTPHLTKQLPLPYPTLHSMPHPSSQMAPCKPWGPTAPPSAPPPNLSHTRYRGLAEGREPLVRSARAPVHPLAPPPVSGRCGRSPRLLRTQAPGHENMTDTSFSHEYFRETDSLWKLNTTVPAHPRTGLPQPVHPSCSLHLLTTQSDLRGSRNTLLDDEMFHRQLDIVTTR